MKKVKADSTTHVLVSMECKFHAGQVSKFYCSHLDCRTHLCQKCLKQHPKEHLPTLNTIENVKDKALTSIGGQIEQKFQKTLQKLLRSDQMHRLFKETFYTLMQQNTTMNLDEEDVADIVADTLARKYLPEEIPILQMTEKNHTLPLEKQDLLSFDSKPDDGKSENYDSDDDSGPDDSGPEDKENEDTREWYESYGRWFFHKFSKFYGRNPLEVSHFEPKNQSLLWNAQYQKLYYGDEGKYTIPKPFHSLTVLGFDEPLFITAADKKLALYYIKDHQPCKLLKEIPDDEIVFLTSDSKRLLFVVSITLEARIYELSNKFELQKRASIRLPDIPKDVFIDSVNGLLFIQYEHRILEIYRNLYQNPRLIKKFRAANFSWHQSSRRLLLLSLGRLYQLQKGNFKLLKVVDKSIGCHGLTEFGIIGMSRDERLYLISQKNPTKKTVLPLPSVEYQMKQLQDDRYGNIIYDLLDHNQDKEIGDLETNFNKIKLVAEDSTHLLIYLNMDSYQSARQERKRYDDGRYEQFGGTVYTQWLLKYNLKKEDLLYIKS